MSLDMEKIKKIKIDLPCKRVFILAVHEIADLIIANEDFTKFRTLDQVISKKGKIDVKYKKERSIRAPRDIITCTLSTGQELIQVCSPSEFHTIGDLLDYRETLKKSYKNFCKEERIEEKTKKQIQKNNEKYLEF